MMIQIKIALWQEEDKSNHDFIAEEKAEGAEEEDYYSIGGRVRNTFFNIYNSRLLIFIDK